MFFNSVDFAIFLPVVFMLYWFVLKGNIQHQNLLIVVASYVFYGWWDWRFLSLIIFSTIVDYSVGLFLSKEEKNISRKYLLWTSVIINLGILGVFKYYNFFLDNFIAAFSFFGVEFTGNSLNIILPVGISFYTFQTLSYTIDIYKDRITATRDFIAFSAFVSFFPQLVAGPIERAKNLLPQFKQKRVFNYSKAIDGVRQILWGLFKKVVIADNCAKYANQIFDNSADYGGATLVLGAFFFTIQIYADFSGYSDIAIGTSRLFGFHLSQNFAAPYFSRNFAEVWRKWHISLSTWFRDYLFIPLVKSSKPNVYTKIRNIFILFITIGFWHGANWKFVVWGALQALLFLPSIFKKNKVKYSKVVAYERPLPSLEESFKMARTFSLIVFTMIFFRATNIEHAISFCQSLFAGLFHYEEYFKLYDYTQDIQKSFTLVLIGFIVIEWLGRRSLYSFEKIGLTWSVPQRFLMYYGIAFCILWFSGEDQQYIYFEF